MLVSAGAGGRSDQESQLRIVKNLSNEQSLSAHDILHIFIDEQKVLNKHKNELLSNPLLGSAKHNGISGIGLLGKDRDIVPWINRYE